MKVAKIEDLIDQIKTHFFDGVVYEKDGADFVEVRKVIPISNNKLILILFESLNWSTTRRTSDRHHLPFGFLVAQSQPPAFFSAAIFSIIRDRPFFVKSCSISSLVYSKQ